MLRVLTLRGDPISTEFIGARRRPHNALLERISYSRGPAVRADSPEFARNPLFAPRFALDR